jgi:hypothetical protein
MLTSGNAGQFGVGPVERLESTSLVRMRSDRRFLLVGVDRSDQPICCFPHLCDLVRHPNSGKRPHTCEGE